MSGTLRVDGTAQDGKMIAVFPDGRELKLIEWAGVYAPERFTGIGVVVQEDSMEELGSFTGIMVTLIKSSSEQA